MQDFVFEDFSITQQPETFAGVNSEFNEVTWFYASNRTEGIMVNSPGQDLSADAAYQGYSGSIVMDMDANDTVYIRMYQDAGTAQMDLNVTSAFAGCLLA